MTYNVFGGTLNLAQSIAQSSNVRMRATGIATGIFISYTKRQMSTDVATSWLLFIKHTVLWRVDLCMT